MTSSAPAPDRRWAIIDFNGVLGKHPTRDDWTALAAAAAWTGPLDDFQQAFWDRRERYDAGTLTAREFWTPLTGPGADPDHAARRDAQMWIGVDPEVLAVLDRAVGAGRRLVMLSNAPAPVAELITAAPWSSRFEHLVFSCHIGITKPDPDAYRAALDAIDNPEPDTVHMVDDRADNIAAAIGLGLNGHHYQGRPAHLERALLDDAATHRPDPNLRLVTSAA